MTDIFKLLRYVTPYKGYVAFAVLTMFVQVFVGFYIPFLMIDIIDVALPAGDFDTVLRVSLVMVGLALFGILSGIVNTYTSQYIAQYATAELRLDFFRKVQELSFKNIDDFKTSRLITNATNDVMRVQMLFTMLFRIVVRAPLMIVMGLVLALRTSLLLSQVFYITIPLLVLSVLILMVKAYPRFKKVQLALDDLNNVVLENANAPQVVKSFVSQPHEKGRFEDTNENYRQANTSAETVMAFAEPVINMIFNMGVALILLVGAYYISQGDFISEAGIPQVGILMAFNSYSMQILIGLMMFSMVMIFLSRANVSASRINEVFRVEIDLVNPPEPTKRKIEGAIAFRDVSFGYGEDGNYALRDVTFAIDKGEKVGIIGSTGSGKSSLMQLLPRLYDVKKGKVLIDDIPVDEYDIATLRDQIGFVTQNATIFSGSPATNILQGKQDANEEELRTASDKALIMHFIDEQAEGFNHLVLPKGTNLSGGQKQRISIARAFIKKPPILILDDATSAVDAESERRILAHIDGLDHEPTLLLISQKIATIRRMDRILVLANDGTVDGFGRHEELMEKSPVYAEIARSQLNLGGEEYVG